MQFSFAFANVEYNDPRPIWGTSFDTAFGLLRTGFDTLAARALRANGVVGGSDETLQLQLQLSLRGQWKLQV